MKVIEGRAKPWYIGLRDRCDSCKALVEFTTSGDVYLNPHDDGDYRSASLYCWQCPECGHMNYDTQSGMQGRR